MPLEVWETIARDLGIIDPYGLYRRLTGDASRGLRLGKDLEDPDKDQ
jgi:hypothetical protein